MTKVSHPHRRDLNQLAARIVDMVTDETAVQREVTMPESPKPELIIPEGSQELLTQDYLAGAVRDALQAGNMPVGNAYTQIIEATDLQAAIKVARQFVEIAYEQ